MVIDNELILIKAIYKDGMCVPIWEAKCVDNDDFGTEYTVNGLTYPYSLVDVYYNINTKEITTGVELEIYQEDNKHHYTYKVGEEVLVETDTHRQLTRAKISRIIWETDSDSIYLGEKMKEHYGFYFKDYPWDFNKLYHLQLYRPKYNVEGSDKLLWDHHIYKLV